ncbi:hypothetical protein BaRGS_00003936 [Batillaria attramentaria]|uniref:DUF7869 domain-containing protein n=1 Tax=Batillaria attramentaria TaxID=370345 RepID=A0ABD0LZL1_9CAEN
MKLREKKDRVKSHHVYFATLKSLPNNINHVVLFSDTCTGQNRNQFVASALLHAAQTLPNISTIDQKFLESGHTHMEVDSMHACIERAKKNVTIHIPDQWNTVIQMARPAKPYDVFPMCHTDIWDFKKVAAQSMRNTKTDVAGCRVNWLKIKWLRYIKGEKDTIFFKYRMPDSAFNQLKIRGSSRRGRQQSTAVQGSSLPMRYCSRLPISEAKKMDLLDLCNLGVIPAQHHHFYKNLPANISVQDRLSEPDVTEDVDTDDE